MPKRKHVLFRVKCRHSTMRVASALGFGFKWKIVYFLCLATPSACPFTEVATKHPCIHAHACCWQPMVESKSSSTKAPHVYFQSNKGEKLATVFAYVTGESRNGRSVRVRIYLFTSCQQKKKPVHASRGRQPRLAHGSKTHAAA